MRPGTPPAVTAASGGNARRLQLSMTSPRRKRAVLPLLLLSLGCATARTQAPPRTTPPWDGTVQVHGALRAMFHEGATGAAVSLDTMLPNPRLHALGALADLAGEITVLGGVAYLAYPIGAQETRTEETTRSVRGAALLVAADVTRWKSVTTTRSIRFDELDQEIAALAEAAGMRPGGRFPFLVEGEVHDLRWHVIDGRRLAGGGGSHQDHVEASVQSSAPSAHATLVGFFSESDQGVFTHMGSRTHLHCVIRAPLGSGHVDHVVIPAGTEVRFPG